jgi:Lar family restriction alleviation protein
MPTEKPLPCPFCGGKPVVRRVGESHYVACDATRCGANPGTRQHPTEAKAIAAWNRMLEDLAAERARPPADILGGYRGGQSDAIRAALTAEVADLRTRAIPADMLELVAIDHGPSDVTIGYVASDPDPATRWQCWSSTQRTGHPTLAAALDAAGRVTP